MLLAKFIWKPLIQKVVTGHWERFRMFPYEPSFPTNLKRVGLYLHVPFCKNLCPFCPYNRVEYNNALFDLYEKAVHKEIELYTPHLKGSEFISLYIGGGTPTVSSITRHHYAGFGPSAASMTGKDFYVDTFDVASYAESLPEKRPIALSMPVDLRLEMAYWLYWRVYELKIQQDDFKDLFGEEYSIELSFHNIIKPFQLAGMLEKWNGGYQVTNSGAYWIHRLQNEYSLNYINRLWGTCRKTPWPKEVYL